MPMRRIILCFLLCFFFSISAFAQSNFTVNQKVEVLWKGTWYKATVLAVKGNAYKVHYDGYASSWDETVPENRIRIVSKENKKATSALKYGKYNCTASKYINGQYEYLPKGSIVFSKDGTYTYYGFEKPSTGKYKVDGTGVITFNGGYLKGGKATPMEGRENRYYVVSPTIPDGRWTCSWVSQK
jgi:hypothetical protein